MTLTAQDLALKLCKGFSPPSIRELSEMPTKDSADPLRERWQLVNLAGYAARVCSKAFI